MQISKTRIIPLLFLLSFTLLTSSCRKTDHDVPPNTDTTSNTPGTFINDTFYWK